MDTTLTIYKNQDIIVNELENEVMIMSIENGEYYHLDEVGKIIWQLINDPISIDSLLKELYLVYEGDKEEIQSDTLTFLGEMLENKLIILNE